MEGVDAEIAARLAAVSDEQWRAIASGTLEAAVRRILEWRRGRG